VNEQFTAGYKIVSEFDAKGTQAAQQGLAGVQQQAQKTSVATAQTAQAGGRLTQTLKGAVGPATALTGALGMSSGGMGKTMQSLAGIMGSLALGPVGLLVAGITAIVGTLGHFKQAAKEARKEFEKQMEEYQSWKGEQVANKYKRIADSINLAAQAQTALNGTLQEYNNATTAKGLAQQDRTNQANISQAKSPAEKAIAEKEAALANARIAGRGSLENAQLNKGNAQTELDRATQAEAQAYNKFTESQRVYKNSGGSAKSANQKLMEEAEKEYIAAIQSKSIADQKAINAQVQLEAVTISNANALQQAEQEVKQATDAYAEMVYQLGLESEARETIANDIATKQAEEQTLKNQLKDSIKAETKAREQAAKDLDRGNQKEGRRDQIAGMGAGEFINDRKAKRDAAKEEAKANERDAKRAERLQQSLKRGSKISKDNSDWLNLYKEWESAKNQGGAGGKERDRAKGLLGIADEEQRKQTGLEKKMDDVKSAIEDLKKALVDANTVK